MYYQDIGIGDKVTPIKEQSRSFEYKGKPIFEDKIALLVYPPEAIFVEKLETVISKGATNSRVKVFYDPLLMTRTQELLNSSQLKKSIEVTFLNRGIKLRLPLFFT